MMPLVVEKNMSASVEVQLLCQADEAPKPSIRWCTLFQSTMQFCAWPELPKPLKRATNSNVPIVFFMFENGIDYFPKLLSGETENTFITLMIFPFVPLEMWFQSKPFP